jgi:hypothetical protein
MIALRPELETPPLRIGKLPRDKRGYPVPWFVAMIDGEPEFRAMDPEKFQTAIRFRKCWICGEGLGTYQVFVLGPMCGISRTTAEPPSHRECALWAARNCPFLARPHAVRRQDDLSRSLRQYVAGLPLDRNPGVVLLWITRRYQVFNDGRGRPLIEIGAPVEVHWIYEGRPATRAEVVASVVEGLPALRDLADEQDRREGAGAVAALWRAAARFEQWYPAEGR